MLGKFIHGEFLLVAEFDCHRANFKFQGLIVESDNFIVFGGEILDKILEINVRNGINVRRVKVFLILCLNN